VSRHCTKHRNKKKKVASPLELKVKIKRTERQMVDKPPKNITVRYDGSCGLIDHSLHIKYPQIWGL
jgi:hypothetical protein